MTPLIRAERNEEKSPGWNFSALPSAHTLSIHSSLLEASRTSQRKVREPYIDLTIPRGDGERSMDYRPFRCIGRSNNSPKPRSKLSRYRPDNRLLRLPRWNVRNRRFLIAKPTRINSFCMLRVTSVCVNPDKSRTTCTRPECRKNLDNVGKIEFTEPALTRSN